MRVALLVLGLALGTPPCLAAADVDLAGKVLHIDSTSGRLSMFLLQGGAFEAFSAKGPAGSGVWRLANGALCATYTQPKPPPQLDREHCMAIAGRNVGDSWAADSRNGAITYSLATGAPPAAGGVRTWM
jgi:hypothetical protein